MYRVRIKIAHIKQRNLHQRLFNEGWKYLLSLILAPSHLARDTFQAFVASEQEMRGVISSHLIVDSQGRWNKVLYLTRPSRLSLCFLQPSKKHNASYSQATQKRTGECPVLTLAVSPTALTVAIATAISVAFRGSKGCADCDLKIGICEPVDINYM